ncbi:MAG: hypothetical protein ACI9LN_004521, partial [Saprospiraceae bacterium]
MSITAYLRLLGFFKRKKDELGCVSYYFSSPQKGLFKFFH